MRAAADDLPIFIPARYFALPSYAQAGDSPLDYLPFVSNMFLHGGWLHLILNMWTLWLFGPAVEGRLGHGRFLAFYLVCGVLAYRKTRQGWIGSSPSGDMMA